jgi:hypothetical protein
MPAADVAGAFGLPGAGLVPCTSLAGLRSHPARSIAGLQKRRLPAEPALELHASRMWSGRSEWSHVRQSDRRELVGHVMTHIRRLLQELAPIWKAGGTKAGKLHSLAEVPLHVDFPGVSHCPGGRLCVMGCLALLRARSCPVRADTASQVRRRRRGSAWTCSPSS